ncbi:uncharacterized protein LOC134060284 [Sardina pilchardus]|uniref:uncharacterized protein LOC134060284 n=1 Tax=Sardina pilchardus TaxID=27697 RepID=UPI002E162731
MIKSSFWPVCWLQSMDQQGSMSLGLNIRLAQVYLALTAICVCCGQPQESSYVFKGFPQNGRQAVQRMGTPDSSMGSPALSPSGEWMAESNWFRRESDRPAPRSLAPGRPQLLTYSSSYSQSGGPTAVRHPSHSLQSNPGSADLGALAVVHSSHNRPVPSQFGYWNTNPVESGAARKSDSTKMVAVGEGVFIERQNPDRPYSSPSVVSSSAIHFLESSAHSGQASSSIQQAHGLGAGHGATVSTSIAEQPSKEALSRGGAQYVKIKLHKRPAWAPHPLTSHHEGQGQSFASVASSSSHAQHGQVNAPVEARREQAPQSNNWSVQSVSGRDGYGLDKPKTREQGEPVQSQYRPYKVIHASNTLAMGQPTDAGSSVPEGHQGLKNADPQVVARPDGLFDPHRSAGDVRKTTRVIPQYSSSSSSSSAKPGWNTNVKTTSQPQGFRPNGIENSKSPVQTKPSWASSGVGESGPRQTQLSPVWHQFTNSHSQSQPGPEPTRGVSGATRVPQQVMNSGYATELSSAARWQTRKVPKPGHVSTGAYNRVGAGAIQSSGRKENTWKGAGLAAIITGKADYGPKFARPSSFGSLSGGSAPSQGVGKSIQIQTRHGYVDVPFLYSPFPGHLRPSSRTGPRLNPDILRRLSEVDQNMARLTQTESSTSSYVVGTRMQLSAGSQSRNPVRPRNPRKFKPVSLADIGGSVVIKSKKRTRSARELNDSAALPRPGKTVDGQLSDVNNGVDHV